ncbi:MAG TPA: response regulator transcription factor [Acidimicrobiales bacterium]|nr:response regulator transcription factor [Acidimicrobiales bacterium]
MPKARILVVEDEDNIAFVIAAGLRMAGFEVVEARTGEDGLRAAEGHPPDLIILDVMLPGIDGFEICRRLRTEGIEAPVVFLTARDATVDRIRGLTIGGDDYLVKPFSVEELLARVRVVLRRSGKSHESQVLSCDDVMLDDEAHRVSRGDQVLHLSPTEYKLLRFLMSNAGRVLSRAQILDHVWDYSFDGESTVVETFVSSLRKKVGTGGRGLIKTVRGVGYRIDAD